MSDLVQAVNDLRIGLGVGMAITSTVSLGIIGIALFRIAYLLECIANGKRP